MAPRKDAATARTKTETRPIGASASNRVTKARAECRPHPGRANNSLTEADLIVAVGASHTKAEFHIRQELLCRSPYFVGLCASMRPGQVYITLENEEPEIFRAVWSWLHHQEYPPYLVWDRTLKQHVLKKKKKGDERVQAKGARQSLTLPKGAEGPKLTGWADVQTRSGTNQNEHGDHEDDFTIKSERMGGTVWRDVLVYCAAESYGLADLMCQAECKVNRIEIIDPGVLLRTLQLVYAWGFGAEDKMVRHLLRQVSGESAHLKHDDMLKSLLLGGGQMCLDLFRRMARDRAKLFALWEECRKTDTDE